MSHASRPIVRHAPHHAAHHAAIALIAISGIGGLGCGSSSTSSSSVSAIAVSPSVCVVGRTSSKQLTAEATLPDGGKEDITSNAATGWSSDNTNTLTVSTTGVVVGVNAGITKVTASFEGASGSVECTVSP
jgi:Bacterial Ig-like domain (group 2)